MIIPLIVVSWTEMYFKKFHIFLFRVVSSISFWILYSSLEMSQYSTIIRPSFTYQMAKLVAGATVFSGEKGFKS